MHVGLKRKFIYIFVLFLLLYIVYLLIIPYRVNIVSTAVENSQDPRQETNYRDWNNYKSIEDDKKRVGWGEQGDPVVLTDPKEIALNDRLYKETGFSVVVSDKISLNRSLASVVHADCMKVKYYSHLPNVSVIIIFHNEVKSVLLRTIHSVINRTPRELLHEVILVNDNSTSSELYVPLQHYIETNFESKVKIKNLTKRSGLIVTRMEGARFASGEVLVFLDSHVEVHFNWLPPLLQPIAQNRRIATLPIIDYFDPFSFGYLEGQESFQGEDSSHCVRLRYLIELL